MLHIDDKKTVGFLLIFFLFPLLFNMIPIVSATPYQVMGDTVYIDDNNVYLSITPHTTMGGWVTFELESKHYSGLIDLVFGFNSSIAYPTKAEYYYPSIQNISRFYRIPQHYLVDDGETRGSYTFTSQDAQNFYDGVVTLEEFMGGEWIVVFNHTFTVLEKTTRIMQWEEAFYREWISLSKQKADWTKIIHSYRGMETWYYLQHEVTQGTRYTLRIWVDVTPQLDGSTSKYWVALKPSGETLQDAISLGHFYTLDPWFNPSWSCRKSHEIENATGSGTNYPLLFHVEYGSGTDAGNTVYLNSQSQPDFDDIRFVDDNGTTLLDYWIENYTESSSCYVWVEIADDLSTENATIYLYYGNLGASSVSNGANTFLYFDDFEDANADWVDSDVGAGQSVRNTDNPFQGSYSYDFSNPGNGHAAIRTNDEVDQSSDFRTITWITAEQTSDTFVQDWDSPDPTHNNVMWYGFRSNGSIVYYYSDYHHIMLYSADTWYRIEVTTDFTNDQYDIYVNSTLKKDNAPFRSSTSGVGQVVVNDYTAETGVEYFDVFIIMKFVDPEPAFGTWGVEEKKTVYITVYFDVGVTQLLLNGSSKTNQSETGYNLGKIVNVTSVIDSDYYLLKYFYNSTTGSINDPLYFQINGNTTIWTYTVMKEPASMGFVFASGFMVFFIGVLCLTIVLAIRRR